MLFIPFPICLERLAFLTQAAMPGGLASMHQWRAAAWSCIQWSAWVPGWGSCPCVAAASGACEADWPNPAAPSDGVHFAPTSMSWQCRHATLHRTACRSEKGLREAGAVELTFQAGLVIDPGALPTAASARSSLHLLAAVLLHLIGSCDTALFAV